MRTKRKLKTRARHHVKLVKNARSRRVKSRTGNPNQRTTRRKRTALRRMSSK